MSANLGEFNLQLSGFADLTKEQATLVQRKVGLEVLAGCIDGSPVDTGRMRAAWIASAGEPSGYVPPEGQHGAPNPSVPDLDFGQDLWVVNNVEYVGFVNDRHPDKAGWVDAAVSNVVSSFEVLP